MPEELSAQDLLAMGTTAQVSASIVGADGSRRFDSDKLDLSIQLFSRAIALDPESGDAFARRAISQTLLGNRGDAALDAAEASKRAPIGLQFTLSIGELLDVSDRAVFYSVQLRQEATPAVRTSILHALAKSLRESGRLKESVHICETALEPFRRTGSYDGATLLTLVEYAKALALTGDRGKAAAAYSDAIALSERIGAPQVAEVLRRERAQLEPGEP